MMNKENIIIQRSLNQITIINKLTCQRLIVNDVSMIDKSDEEIKNFYLKQGVMTCLNNRV